MAEPPQLNQLLRARIHLPSTRIDVNLVAVRIVTDPQGRTGVGVKFFALNGTEKRAWEAYITNIVAPRRAAA